MKRALCWILLLLMALPMTGQAQEEILSFNSSIQVNTDGSILVEETIQVRAEGDAIQRGIYRYFPTEYTDQLGNHYRVDFKLMEVLKDSVSEPYRIVPQDNGVRVYIGNSNVYLGQGVYSYTLRYSTYWQLGFFEKHDELYWNVTGNQWNFPILQTSARVELPVAVPTNSISVEGYTGVQGSQGSDYVAEVSSGTARYKATRTLKAGEGLTIVVSWPKGFITEPTEEQHMARLLKDNQSILVAAAGVALLLFYYLAIWYRLGRDPEGGVVIPHYMPPKGFSPASMRFIRRMDYDDQTFATAIVNMAVAGYLRIEENSKKTFSLHKTGALPKLATGEGAIGSALFGGGNNSIELTQKNYRNISKAVRVHKNALKRDYEKLYFVTNRLTILPGVLLSIGLILACVLSIPSVDERVITGFLAFWLSVWSAGVYMLVKNALGNWMAISTEEGSIGGAIFSTLFAVPFICGEVLGLAE